MQNEIAAGNRSPRRRGSGAQLVYETLRREVLDLSLRPGELLDETSLSERFSMSRSPIREALIRLTAEGLVTTLPNKNTLVSSINLEEFPAYIDALDLIQRVTTRLAARNRTEEDISTIKAIQAEFLETLAEGDVAGMIETNRDFHISISEAARNQYYHALHIRLMDDGKRMLHLYFKSFGDTIPRDITTDHDRIIEAIEAKSETLAEKCAHEHVLEVSERFLRYMSMRQTAGFDLFPND